MSHLGGSGAIMRTLLCLALMIGGCAAKQIDVTPPDWKANSERTAVIGKVHDSTVIITRHGHTRDYYAVLDGLNLGPATVEQYDLYWVTPLTK